MGCGGSKSKKVEKDASDRTLDDCSMEDTGIVVYDDAFSKGGAPLQKLVDVNNLFLGAVDAVQSAAAVICGAYLVELKAGTSVSFEVFKPPKEEKEKKITVLIGAGGPKPKLEIKDNQLYDTMFGPQTNLGKDIPKMFDTCNEVIGPLNKALGEASLKVESKYNRLVVVETDDSKTAKTATAKTKIANDAIDKFNAVYFPVKLNLCKAVLVGGLKDACREVVENIKKHVKDAVPTVNVDLAKLAEGDLVFEVSMGEIDFNVLPTMIKTAWDSIMGPEGLIAIMKLAAQALAEVKGDLEAAKEAIEALPKDPKEIMDKAKESGVGPMAASKIPAKIKRNVEQFARGPDISQTFVENLKGTCEEVSGGLVGGAKDGKTLLTGAGDQKATA